MSTRAIIARPTPGDGFEGRYHHWDGYPSGLGHTLFELANGHFADNLPRMMQVLCDEHPAGWSTINGKNFSLASGFTEDSRKRDKSERPECYCHGDRSEEAMTLTHDGDDGGAEWAYVIDEHAGTMAILEKRWEDGKHATGFFGIEQGEGSRWTIRAIVHLNDMEPNWKAIESGLVAA